MGFVQPATITSGDEFSNFVRDEAFDGLETAVASYLSAEQEKPVKLPLEDSRALDIGGIFRG